MDSIAFKLLKSADRIFYLMLLTVAMVLGFNPSLSAQEEKPVPDGTEGVFHVPPGIDSITGKEKPLPPNEFQNGISTFKVGLGYIHDFVTYAQDDIALQQMDSLGVDLRPDSKARDFRILASGRIKSKRTLTWKFAFMWDGNLDEWLVRESGIIVGVPELSGHIFLGRTKEGFSMVKVMNGHSPWAAERQMALDLIPIIADGIKYYGFLPKSRIFWNLGYFNDLISKGQGFSTYEWQYAGRVGWMPFYDAESNKLLHIAGEFRYGKTLNGQFRARSRPESNPTPYFIDTGTFPADHSTHLGAEIFYSSGRFMAGTEILSHAFTSDIGEDHRFTGGNVVLSYFFTNTKRPYSTVGSIYGFVPAGKSIFKNGWGAWEGVLTFSSFNLNDGSIKGGSCWRITPMVNWYMSKIMRSEFIYGFGQLDRFNLKGNTQFFQYRIQFTIM